MIRTFPLLCALALQGCGQFCTQMEVWDYLSVKTSGGSWADGDYEIALSGDVEGSCTMTLSGGQAEEHGCDVADVSWVWEPRDGAARLEIRNPLPEYLHLSLLHDSVESASAVFEPQYELDEPNGEGCGERISATETWDLDS